MVLLNQPGKMTCIKILFYFISFIFNPLIHTMSNDLSDRESVFINIKP